MAHTGPEVHSHYISARVGPARRSGGCARKINRSEGVEPRQGRRGTLRKRSTNRKDREASRNKRPVPKLLHFESPIFSGSESSLPQGGCGVLKESGKNGEKVGKPP